MQASLVSITPNAQGLIVHCARVSNPTSQENGGGEERLLSYMVRNQHWSPFEMAHMVIEIETTRDIARQILRHRSFSFQEFSQRYAEVTPEFIQREARLQDTANRQSSLPNDDAKIATQWMVDQRMVQETTLSAYKRALYMGIAKEVARAVLPEGMTPSRLYMAGSIRSWIHYSMLRTGNGTQKEHVEVAQACKEILQNEIPALRNP